MKKGIFLIPAILLVSSLSYGQIKIGGNPASAPNPKSLLEVDGTGGKGMRLPQLDATEIAALKSSITAGTAQEKSDAKGLLIYDTSARLIKYWSGNTTDFLPLFQPITTCIAPTSVAITPAGPLTMTRYSTDLELTAIPSGGSANADVYYEWYKNDQVITDSGNGAVLVVKQSNLGEPYTGTYKVEARACGSAPVQSNAVNLTINSPYSLIINTVLPTVNGNNPTVSDRSVLIDVTDGCIPVDILILEDKDRMYKSHSSFEFITPTQYRLTFELYPSARNTREMKFLVLDTDYEYSSVYTITENGDPDKIPDPSGTVTYHVFNDLVNPVLTMNYADAFNYCRTLTWISPRASLLNEEAISTEGGNFTQATLPADTYWLWGKSQSEPATVSVSWSLGSASFDVNRSANPAETHRVKCVKAVYLNN
jgi:hypothetical protein